MPFEPGSVSEARSVSEESQEAGLGSLRGCLVEGDAEQRNRERRVRRRALVISVLVQSAVLAALILVPLFGKTPRIAFAFTTPIPPYSSYRGTSREPVRQPHPVGQQRTCYICATSIPPTIPTRDAHATGDSTDNVPFEPGGINIPGAPDGLIPLSDARRRVVPPDEAQREVAPPKRLHTTTIDPAMLTHRVEPAYPILPKQMHREGRVELRAIIGIDGSIQSLQVVAGDLLFVQSALDAVQQWRYKPTYLNGQPVEIDTYITVVYTMPHY
jgi:protein TonB